jgi:L-lactate dehydrogenase complex protein LldF
MDPESMAMKWLAKVFVDRKKFERAQKVARLGQRFFMKGGVIESLPGPFGGWTATRDVFPVAQQSFREWWRTRS